MRRATEGTRVLGPYKHGSGWRLATVRDGVKTFTESVPSEEEAQRLKRHLEKQIAQSTTKTWAEVLEEYQLYLADRGNKPGSVATNQEFLRRFLSDQIESPISPFTKAAAEKCYEEMRLKVTKYGRPLSAASSRNSLAAMKAMGRWMVKKGYWRENSVEKVEPIGRPNKGKAQLHLDEARRWLVIAYQLAEGGDLGATAALLTLLLGMRVGEVVGRVARDIDDGGKLLWIDHGKTRKARRRLKVPKRLQPLLLKLCDGKDPSAKIFPITTCTVRNHVRKLCRLAETPVVCPHAMRGLLATLAVEGGEVLTRVADELGHESVSMTLGHYASPGSERAGQVERAGRVLEGG